MKWGARIYGHVYGKGDPPWDSESWNLFEQHAGKRTTILSYGQPFGAIDTDPLRRVTARGNVPLVTVMDEGTNIEAIAAGDVDDRIDGMARSLAAVAPASPVLRFCHEQNGNWYRYGYGHADPAIYRRAFRRVCSRAKAIAPNARLCWCPNVIGGKTVDDPRNWYPGAGYVDLVGVDGYNQSGLLDVDVFSPTLLRLREFTRKKPIWICETGCIEAPTKGPYLADMLKRQVPAWKVNALVYFNGDPVENGLRRTWPIESSAAATQGFREGIAQSRYEGAAT